MRHRLAKTKANSGRRWPCSAGTSQHNTTTANHTNSPQTFQKTPTAAHTSFLEKRKTVYSTACHIYHTLLLLGPISKQVAPQTKRGCQYRTTRVGKIWYLDEIFPFCFFRHARTNATLFSCCGGTTPIFENRSRACDVQYVHRRIIYC